MEMTGTLVQSSGWGTIPANNRSATQTLLDCQKSGGQKDNRLLVSDPAVGSVSQTKNVELCLWCPCFTIILYIWGL